MDDADDIERRPWGRWLIALALLGGAGWALTGFLGGDDRGSGVRLATVEVDRGDLQQTVSATGQLNPVVNVQVGSQVSGMIDEIMVDFNSEVRRGQVLARLDTATFEANVRQAEGEVASAEAALQLAEVEVQRLRQLSEREIVSRAEVDQAEARLKQAEATLQIRSHALDRAQSELARCTIYSPIDGIVISRDVDVGQTVAASMTAPVLFTIANDLTQMQINSLVPEADIGGVRDGQHVHFTVDAHPTRRFEGTVVQVRNAPVIEQNVVTYDTVIEVHNPEGLLKPGMTATVTIVTDEQEDVLRVRNTALRARLPDAVRPTEPPLPADTPEPGTAWRVVYRLPGGNPDGPVEAVAVLTGATDGLHTEVLEGLAPGDVLATGVDLEATATGNEGRGGGLFGPAPAQF